MSNIKISVVTTAIVATLFGSLALNPTNIRANDIQTSTTEFVKEQINEQFSSFNKNEKVVALPLGGYIQGEAKVGNLVNGKIDESSWVSVDSATNPNAISITQAEQVAFDKYETAISAQNNPFQTFAASPPATSNI